MRPNRFLRCLALAAVLSVAAPPIARGELTAEQRTRFQQTVALIREVSSTYQAGQYQTAGQTLIRAMQQLQVALRGADKETFEKAETLFMRIERDHALIQLEGIVLPPFERPVYGVSRPSYLDADGPVATAPLVPSQSPQPTASSTPTPTGSEPEMGKPGGAEPINFARQIAPLLVANCDGCHIDAMQTRGGLRMDSIAQLLRGGDSGPIVVAGDGDGSLLVRKLLGQEGNRMPAGGRPPLADDEIELIRRWIAAGAPLDGASPEQALRVMMSEAWANNATHDALAERRRELARKHWQLAAPAEAREAAVEVENEEVLVLGNVRSETAEHVARAATAALKKVRTIIPPPPRGEGDSAASPFKGRITLFVFPRRYDYSEFSKMVEQRELPAEWDAHWEYDGVDAYASLVVSDDNLVPKTLQARLLAPLASLSLAARGELPRWLSEGVGRATAARLAARDFDAPKQWDAALPAAVGIVKDADQLLEGKLPPAQTDLVGYGIGKTLIDRGARRQFAWLLRNLDSGGSFEEAFTAAFGGPPKVFVTTWFAWYASSQRR